MVIGKCRYRLGNNSVRDHRRNDDLSLPSAMAAIYLAGANPAQRLTKTVSISVKVVILLVKCIE